MTWGITPGAEPKKTFVVECKRCLRHIPAGVEAFPSDNLRVDCPLCGEKRRYRPSEVYLGTIAGQLGKQQAHMSEHYRIMSERRRRA